MKIINVIAFLSLLLLMPCSFASNTDAFGAIQYEIGQGWITSYFDASESERWFTFKEEGGHSYCVEVAQGSLSPNSLPSQIDIYSSEAGSTLLTSNNRTLSEANAEGAPSRICYISPQSQGEIIRAVKVSAISVSSNSTSGYLKLRILDTTLFAPSFNVILYKKHSTQSISSSVSDGVSLINYSKEQVRYTCTPVFTSVPTNLAPVNPTAVITEGAMPPKLAGACVHFITYDQRGAFFPLSGEMQFNVSGYIHIAHEAPPGQVHGYVSRHTTGGITSLSTIY